MGYIFEHNIEQDVTAIIMGKLNSSEMKSQVIQPSMDALKKKILDNTAKGLDVTGKPFEAYSPEYARRKKSATPNLRYQDLSLESLYGTPVDNQTGYMSAEKDPEMLNLHQTGVARRARGGRLPQRKIFPEPKDAETGDMKDVLQTIGNLIELYFNA